MDCSVRKKTEIMYDEIFRILKVYNKRFISISFIAYKIYHTENETRDALLYLVDHGMPLELRDTPMGEEVRLVREEQPCRVSTWSNLKRFVGMGGSEAK